MGDPNLGGDANLVRKFVHELDMARCQIHWRRRFASLYDGPAVIALACQMFDRKELIRENITKIATTVTVSSVRSLFGTAALLRSLGIKNPALKHCVVSRIVTSALAIAIAGIFEADTSVSVSVDIVTGLIGANVWSFYP